MTSKELLDSGHEIPSLDECSDSKNSFGVQMSTARPVGSILLVISLVLCAYFSLSFFATLSIGDGILAWLTAIGVVFMAIFRLSEREWVAFGRNLSDNGDNAGRGDDNQSVRTICRECKEELSPEVNRCPHCGWKPKKRGALWWGGTALMSLNPIGWAMGAKGASDKIKAAKGVSKEVPAPDESPGDNDQSTSPDSDPTETLERLAQLKEQGIITEDEFEEKKAELLDQI